MQVSERALNIPSFMVVDVIDRASEMIARGEDVIMLAVGEPDFCTPEPIIQACRKALSDGCTHYTPSLGILALREAICEDYHKRYAVEISPDQIIVTPGTSPAMFLVFSGILEQGDEIILSDPGYPCYKNMIEYVGGRSVLVPVYEEEGFQYRPESIKQKISDRTKAIMVNSPSNPTGNLLSPERMAQVADLGPMIISDEIYHGLVYEGREHSILEYTDQAIVLNGFSKRYAMTGWRIGYCILPGHMVRPLQKVQQNFFISTGDFVQWAALAAIKEAEPDVVRMREEFGRRRRVMLDGLKQLGLGITHEPTGAFYVLANTKHLGMKSLDLTYDILEKVKVGVAPGIDFGPNTEGYLRFSYATSLENIKEGLRRIGQYLKSEF